MESRHGKQSDKAYAGSRYYREFISRMRRDEDAGRFEHLEDYPYDILVDDELGIRLYHAGINPYDQEHFRHQLYLVVLPHGKASKLCRPDTVVASALTLQWTRRGDVCNALLLSVKSFGQCTFAYCGQNSHSKCGWCGHTMKTLLWRNNAWRWLPYRPGRRLAQGERHCCVLNQTLNKYQCCKCKDPDNALMSPLDRAAAAELPQSVLPPTPDAYRRLHDSKANGGSSSDNATADSADANGASDNSHSMLVSTPSGPVATASPSAPTPTVNNFHLNFYGNNHIYQGPSGIPTPFGAPSGWSFATMSSLEMETRTRGLLDYAAALSSANANSGTAGRVQEIEDVPDPTSDAAPTAATTTTRRTPPKYASPRVEDDVADVADTSGAAHPMAKLALSR